MYWQDWINTVAGLLEYQVVNAQSQNPTSTADFNNTLPAAVAYTELRLQRDLDLLNTITTVTSGTLAPNNRTVVLPSTDIPAVSQNPQLVGNPVPANSTISTVATSQVITIDWTAHGMSQGQNLALLNPFPIGGLTLGGVYQVASVIDANTLTIMSPFAATSTATGIVVGNGIFIVCTQIRLKIGGKWQAPLEFVTRDFLDYVWPDDDSVGANIPPIQWAPKDQVSILVGPAPDQAYPFEAVGTMRVPPLSAANYTNILTQQFFDLYVACSMVYFTGFQRDFGGQSDNPQMGTSWEAQYQALLKSAQVEETRKKFANMFPSPSYPVPVAAQTG